MSGLWHIIAPEYPPNTGGVGDYSKQLALNLRSAGDEVHVWCPGGYPHLVECCSWVHRVPGGMTLRNLRGLGKAIDRVSSRGRILVQWVPHGFGWKSMNVPFCFWLWNRSRKGAKVDIMMHEVCLPFRRGSWRQNFAGLVHRIMAIILLRAANRVWLATPAWERTVRTLSIGRKIPCAWLPINSNIPTTATTLDASGVRRHYPSPALLGHFGTYGTSIKQMLWGILPPLLLNHPDRTMLLMGDGGADFRQTLVDKQPALARQIVATGRLEAHELSSLLKACDVLLQPYPDGVTARRGSVLAALSHGAATVSTLGELSEPIWKNSGALALADAGDAASFVKLVEGLIDAPEERETLQGRARAFYIHWFDPDKALSMLRTATL